ncbi:Golgi apparatus membrane TVP38 [Hyphodiscus hymeniophilus]|uniref:Golgi apparatus membrane TVP38 n=1 Tax=Hyphodiscus hymeniophilus TaxID=353542 RepID=A0A9P6VLT6_9HELO|nr:Golgi apparatus membrane TVP38 [Hyphodiscus hymeniophilus]
MDGHQNPPYPQHDAFPEIPQNHSFQRPNGAPATVPNTFHPAPAYDTPASSYPDQLMPSQGPQDGSKFEPLRMSAAQKLRATRLSKKWQMRLYWIIPLGILAIVLVVLFEVYKDDFERWVQPLANWLTKRDAWSWTIPVAILVILSFPPLFGHEIVQIIVGLSYPIGVAIGIACAGAILGEAAAFIVFKYGFTSWVEKKIATKVRWAAVARVAQEAGFKGVLIIRYSIVPPLIISLPKTIVFVVLGAPTAKNSKGAKWAKVVAIGVVVIITIFASIWIRRKMAIAVQEIEAERGISHNGDDQTDEELGMLRQQTRYNVPDETSYSGAGVAVQYPYQDTGGPQSHRQS